MEISALLFFEFWLHIGPIFLSLGFYTLDKTDLSSSVPPPVMFFFKHFLENFLLVSTVLCLQRYEFNIGVYNSSYIWTGLRFISAVIHCTGIWMAWSYILWYFSIKMMFHLNMHSVVQDMNFPITSLLIPVICIAPALCFSSYVLMIFSMIYLLLIGAGYYMSPPRDTRRLTSQIVVETFLLIASHMVKRYFEVALMSICLLVILTLHPIESVRGSRIEFVGVQESSLWWAQSFPFFFPISVTGARIEYVVGIVVAKVKETKLANFIEFAVGMVGSIHFQNFFRLISFSEVVAFLYLAVAWLTILVLSGASYDFGVLNFLLGNVVVGCTVGQLGLQYKTRLVYAASLILYGGRLKLQSLTIVRRPNQKPQVVLW